MKWSWKLGRFAGIDVYIHATFWLMLGWFMVPWFMLRTVGRSSGMPKSGTINGLQANSFAGESGAFRFLDDRAPIHVDRRGGPMSWLSSFT